MTANKKKVLITETTPQGGWDVFTKRDDIDAVRFPNAISAADFDALLKEHAPVHGVALGPTRFGENEISSARDIRVVARMGVGYDAIDVPALTAKKIALMTTGIANSPSVAEEALFMMLTLAKRGAELDAMVKAGQWGRRLNAIPFDLFGKTVVIVGFGRIGTRTAKRCAAMDRMFLFMIRLNRPKISRPQVINMSRILMPCFHSPTSSAFTVRRHRKRSGCSTRRG